MTFIFLFLILAVIIGGFSVYAILTTKKAKANGYETWLMKFYAKDSVKTIISSVTAILLGLLVGCLFLIMFVGSEMSGRSISGFDLIDALQLIFFGGFNTGRNEFGSLIYGWNGVSLGNMLFRATPLILTGLSVGVAYKTGLFNIGAPGQYLMGTAAALIVSLTIPSDVIPPFIIWIIAFLSAIIAGALWASIVGLFKAFLNVNEVITCIMTNWIAAILVTSLFDKTTGPFNFLLDPSGDKNYKFVYKTAHNGVETIKLGLDKLFPGSQINAGIIVAILIAILMFIIINKTTFGYSLKSCGSNKHAAQYAGINSKLYITLSMAIAGGLAAAGAALYYLSGNTEFTWSTYQSLPAIGFNGIPVALLASCNPIGIIFSASFMAYLDISGLQIRNMTMYNEYISSIVSALIVYFSAFALIFKQILSGKIKLFRKKKEDISNAVDTRFKEEDYNVDKKEETDSKEVETTEEGGTE
ncbi:ABC transporter permease [bacterium]|nr:ABC transporter permease [bacterium]